MARWSNATLVALGGFDKNVIIDELLYGEDNYYDITFATDTGRTVLGVAGATVTLTNGDTSVFVVGGFVTFGTQNNIYQIASKTSTQLVLTTTPVVPPANGASVQIPIDVSSATFSFRLLQHSAEIQDDTRAGVDIGNITPYPGATSINLDSNVIKTVPTLDATKGQIRVLVNAADFTYAGGQTPIIDTTSPPFFTGYIGVDFPPTDIATPSQTKKQRICFVVRADGTNS